MRVILFDTSDASRPELRQRTLRVIDDEQHVVLQGLVYSASGGRELCARIAAGLGATFEFVGPAKSVWPAKSLSRRESELAVRNTVSQYCPECDQDRLHVALSDSVVECSVCGDKGAVIALRGPVESREVALQGLLF